MLICKNADNTVRWKSGERLSHYFEQRCDALPADQLAVVTEDVSVTFRELDNRANQAARYLIEQGFKAGQRIAVLFDKSIHGYVAALAVQKIGAAYVPLDASFPNDRIAFILEDSEAKGLLSVSRYREKIGEFPVKQVYFDTVQQEIAAKPTARLTAEEAPPHEDQLFYIIYTSGTTGKPKGVAIDHAGICNFVKVAGETYGIRVGDRAYQGMTLAFDFHVEDLWTPLIAGATLISGKSGANLFGNDLYEFLKKHRVTVLPCVPTLWATIEQDLPDVRIILLSGESVPHHLVVRWYRPGRSILNAYGPTECSVSSTIRFLVPERPVTIGAPLPTYTVVILAEDKAEEVPDGGIGEICIAGVSLARGYINREDLTREKFIPDFLNIPNNPSGRIYRTGDLGRIREDGELDFNGRIDTQVKLRGYRIELGEIEAVLMQVPQIAQAVVQPIEVEPGATDLVAYYTRKQGAPAVALNEVAELLRKNLPGYMVPGYLEELAAIPMTSNNKADRKNLPMPKGPRFSASSNKFVEPRTETEKVLSECLMEVMKIDRVSIEDNFFQDLGAHSLLMARFGAEIRKRLQISAISMRDIYLNPTLDKLARHIDTLPKETPGGAKRRTTQEDFHVPSDFSYFTCGALQFAWYVGWIVLGLWVFVAGVRWSYAGMPSLGETYLRIIAFAVATSVVFTVICIALKWLLIGKWKQEVIPVWSLRYFRFWAAKAAINGAPMAYMGDPFYTLYLRLLGAKIGKNTVVQSATISVCTDLISIGSNTILSKESIVLGYAAQSNRIYTGPIEIGSNAYVGEAAVIDVNTVMEDDTQLGTASSLHSGQRIGKGKRYHGSPAVETTADYCPVEPRKCTPTRRWAYAIGLLALSLVLLPLPVLLSYYLYPTFYGYLNGPAFAQGAGWSNVLWLTGAILWMSFSLFCTGLVTGLLVVGVVPRILNVFLRAERTYTLYGFHYFIHTTIVAISNSAPFNRLFGDSSAIVHYVRWVGYRLGKIIQTGSNFGMSQRHENPFMCDIGSGTMVSGGLKMVNETMSSSSFKLGQVTVGKNTYLGNYLHFPSDAKVGTNCLIATKALVPIDGPIRENVGLLGSPCFEIPRATDRDKQMAKMDEPTRRRQLKAKNKYNLMTGTLFLLSNWVLLFIETLCWTAALLYYPRYGMSAIFWVAAVSFFFAVFWMWFVERASLKFSVLEPRIVPVLHEYFWFHERVWKLTGLWFIAPAFSGTPFKNIFSRLEGVRVGKRVFDDGAYFDEYSLIEIGDYTTLNAACVIQPHSLEEAVFKSGRVKLGRGCTLGVASNLHYDVTLGDYVVIEPNSFVMKGEIIDSNTTWRGNPARSVAEGDVRGVSAPASRPALAEAKVA